MFPLGQRRNSERSQARGGGTGRNRRYGSAEASPNERDASRTLGRSEKTFFLDIDAARASLGPTKLIEVFTSFKQAVSNHLLDMPEVRETVQTGRPVDIAGREIERFQAEQRFFREIISRDFMSLEDEGQNAEFGSAAAENEDQAAQAGKSGGAKKQGPRGTRPEKIPSDKDPAENKTSQNTMLEERLKEERKMAHEQAKAVVKALIQYQRNCQEAVKEIFNPSIMSKSIINGIDSILGEHDEERHHVPGYGTPGLPGAPPDTKDNGRRRYDVARERGYICVLFQGLEALFAPKVRQNEKTLLLKEFFMFAYTLEPKMGVS